MLEAAAKDLVRRRANIATPGRSPEHDIASEKKMAKADISAVRVTTGTGVSKLDTIRMWAKGFLLLLEADRRQEWVWKHRVHSTPKSRTRAELGL